MNYYSRWFSSGLTIPTYKIKIQINTIINLIFKEVFELAKDSQLDPKQVRVQKSKGGPTMAQSALDGENRNNKKQSGNRHKPGDDK